VRILSVGRLIEEKGFIYLLRALKLLQDRGCTFRCEIVGAPDESSASGYYAELQALWRRLGLEPVVTFVGALPFNGVLEKYADADMFVLPSVTAASGGRDVTPNALIEAMAMGLPVVSTRMSGIPEIVEHGVSGLLVPPRNDRALAHALEGLIADPCLRRRLGQNARRRVEVRFDIRKNILPLGELFQQA
jgi:glycosyltransferase involved in cell wall biosynthesis